MSPQLVLTHARLFDGDRYFGDDHHAIGISNGKISSVERGDGEGAAGPDVRRVNLAGRLVMPGLIDAHTHATGASLDVGGLDKLQPSYLAHYAGRYLRNMLQQGFTSIRDAGGGEQGLVQALEEGLLEGPRYLIAGKALSQTGGHGDMRGHRAASPCKCDLVGAFTRVVDGENHVREAVRDQFRQGANHIKIFVSGGVLSPTDPIWSQQFSNAEIAVAVEEAARWRSYVMAHAHTKEAIVRCAEHGVRSIEHASMMDREAAEIVARKGAFVVPTLGIVKHMLDGEVRLPAGALDKLKYLVDAMYAAIGHSEEAGVKVGLGTDLLGSLQGRETQELVLRGELSSSLNVLRSATSVNAELLGIGAQAGRIKAGFDADLIVMDKNPVEDITVFRDPASTVVLVMKAGAVCRDTLRLLPADSDAGIEPSAVS
jgi:imidazolonepropionase-like amidohydrolase